MRYFVFALKRVLRRPLLIGLLVLCVLAMAFAGRMSGEVSLPSAGVFDGSRSEESGRIVSHLTDNGFVECGSPEELTELVREGQLDCGVILPEDLVRLMARNDLEGRIPWIVSPASYIPDLYRDHAAAAIFREYAPYITAELFEGTAVSEEAVLREYEKMFENGYAFSFDNAVVDGGMTAGDSNRRSLIMGVAAILLCAAAFALCADVADTSLQEILRRLGLRKMIVAVVIPGLAVRMLLLGAAGCLGLLLAGEAELIAPLLVYIVLLTGTGVILSGLLRNVRLIYTLMALVVAGSAALCPIYTDAALALPILKTVRCVLPPYWLWLLPGNLPAGAAAAAAALLGGIALLVVRYAVSGKYSLRPQRGGKIS